MAILLLPASVQAQSPAQAQIPIALGTTITPSGVGITGNFPADALCDTCYSTGVHPSIYPFVPPVDMTQLPVGTRPAVPSLSAFAVILGNTIGTNVGQPENLTAKTASFCLALAGGRCGGTNAPSNYLGWSVLIRNGSASTRSSNNYGVLVGGALATVGGSKLGLYESYVNTFSNFGGAVAIQAGTLQATRSTISIVGDHSPGVIIDGVNSLFTSFTGNVIMSNGTQSSGIQATNGATVALDSDAVSSTGTLAHGLYGNGAGTNMTVNASNITSNGQDAHVVFMQNGAVATFTDTELSAAGAGGFGVYATGAGSVVTLTGGSVSIQGSGGQGLQAELGGSIIADAVALHTEGAQGHGATMRSGGILSLTNMTVTADGSGAAGLFVTGTGTGSSATLDQVTLITPQGPSIAADGGSSTVVFNNSTAVSNNGVWLSVTSADPAHPTSIAITADPSVLQGTAFTDALSTSTVTLVGGTTWTMTGNSNLTTLTNDASTIIFAAPSGDPAQAASFKTLTVHSYNGANGGALILNTMLGSDNAPSDRLVINGGTASGSTILSIVNADGLGARTTGDGILVVQALNGATTDTNAFHLSQPVIAGAFEYLLLRGSNSGTGDPNDQNWYLRNTLQTADGPITIVRPEVPVSMVIPPLAVEYGYAMLDTLHERVGETYLHTSDPVTEERVVWCKDASQNFKCTARVPFTVKAGVDQTRWASSGWARLIGNRGFQNTNDFEKRGADYDYTFGGIQAGLDIYGREQADGTLDKAGIYVGYGQITSDVKGQFGGKVGSVDMDAYTIGGYWTHRAPSGWYTDVVVQGTWYSTDAHSIYGASLKPDGFGILGSLEGGYAFKLGNGFTLEPQVQVVYQDVSFDNEHMSDAFVRFDDGDSLRGRLGVRVTKTWNRADEGREPRLVTAWLRANVWHEFMGTTKTSWGSADGLNMTPFRSSLGGTWGEIGAGVTVQATDKINIFATGAYNRSLDNRGREGWDGRLGMTVKW